jgi:hypothetical protein
MSPVYLPATGRLGSRYDSLLVKRSSEYADATQLKKSPVCAMHRRRHSEIGGVACIRMDIDFLNFIDRSPP